MKTKMIWANLPVSDVQRTEAFYTALGITPNTGPKSPGLTSFLFGKNDFPIHFFRRDKLEASMNDKAIPSGIGSEVVFSLSAESEEEVVAWVDNVKEAGGKIVREAARQEDGYYYCVFADPDGHKFNVLLIEKGM